MLSLILLIIFQLFTPDILEFKNMTQGYLIFPDNKKLLTYKAIKEEDQIKGFSGIKEEQLNPDSDIGLLFVFKKIGIRQFWMPDTYFNLDIIYLDEKYSILKIDRNVPYHPGKNENIKKIPIASTVKCLDVLEIPTKSTFTKKIKIGDQLKWAPMH